MPNHAGFHLGTLPGDIASYAYAINHLGTFIVGQSFRELPRGTIYNRDGCRLDFKSELD